MTNTKDVEIMKDNTPLKKDMDKIVEDIVVQWNSMVLGFQNTSIALGMMIKERLKNYPNESQIEIMKRVRNHPNIKRFVSVGRIYHSTRMLDAFPEVEMFYKAANQEEKNELVKKYNMPVKEDGHISGEWYMVLEKSGLSMPVARMLSDEGIQNKWSIRELIKNCNDKRFEMENPLGYESRKKAKYELIRDINKILKEMEVDRLRGVLNFCKEFSQPNFGIDEKELKRQG